MLASLLFKQTKTWQNKNRIRWDSIIYILLRCFYALLNLKKFVSSLCSFIIIITVNIDIKQSTKRYLWFFNISSLFSIRVWENHSTTIDNPQADVLHLLLSICGRSSLSNLKGVFCSVEIKESNWKSMKLKYKLHSHGMLIFLFT